MLYDVFHPRLDTIKTTLQTRIFIMELNEIDGFDRDGNPTTIQLPVYRVVKQALLALDYSQGALENQRAANQLADQFCLSEMQRTVAKENG